MAEIYEDLYEDVDDDPDESEEEDEKNDNEKKKKNVKFEDEKDEKDDKKDKKKDKRDKSVKLQKRASMRIKDVSLLEVILKMLFIHIDKITLIVMYLVTVNIVNIVHFILVITFVMQIVFPSKMHYFYKPFITIFQLLYLAEFLFDFLKIKFLDFFKQNKAFLELFLVYSEDEKSNDIEIFIFAIVYCFNFQYRAFRTDYIKNLLKNHNINLKSYLKQFFSRRKSDGDGENKKFMRKLIGVIFEVVFHVYLWFIVFNFIVFSCYFEMNLIFLVKLILFFISCYAFLITIQSPDENSTLIFKTNDRRNNFFKYRIINKIIVLICCLNTVVVYLYQFLCKEYFDKDDESEGTDTNTDETTEETNIFLANLPAVGFTLYKEENLYYNFLPYFMICFVIRLYKRATKQILYKVDKNLFSTKTIYQKEENYNDDIHQSFLEKQESLNKIKTEKNEFIRDNLYADRFDKNNKEIKSKSKQLIRIFIILLLTKVYWLFLFLFLGFIYSYYNLSLSIFIYIAVFGIVFLKMFNRLIYRLKVYLDKPSYYISKVVRYSMLEKPRHYEINNYYRKIAFRSLLFCSFTYLVFFYLYGVFDLVQHGCNSEIFKGCDSTHKNIMDVDPNEESDKDPKIAHNNTEALIKSIAFLFGFYFNTQKNNLLDVCWIHLFVTIVLITDLYNKKLEEHYYTLRQKIQKEVQILVNENNILERYSDLVDNNILIKIGLTLAGYDLTSSNDRNQSFNLRKTLNKDILGKKSKLKLNNLIGISDNKIDTVVEEDIKSEEENYSSNNEDDSVIEGVNVLSNVETKNRALSQRIIGNRLVQKFLKVFINSNTNQQQLSIGNTKNRLISLFKNLFEETIIFVLLTCSLAKLSIWTFIYLIITVYLIVTKKTMWKFFLLSVFIYFSIVCQSIFFLTNLSANIFPRDDNIYQIISVKLGVPWAPDRTTEKEGFFFGLGICDTQIRLLCVEFLQIIIIFFYLDMFSYAVFQDVPNKGESPIKELKFNYESLNLKPDTIDHIKNMTDLEFYRTYECLKCYDISIGNSKDELVENLKLKRIVTKDIILAPSNIKESKSDFDNLDNKTLKELIKYRLQEKESRKIGQSNHYKKIPKYMSIILNGLYLYCHIFILVLIILLSVLISGAVSGVYFAISLYYLVNCDLLITGQKYTYYKTIKTVLRTFALIDILIQALYQTPMLSPDADSELYNVFNAIGFIKVIDFGEDDDKVTIYQVTIEVFSKVMIYWLISIQILIFESKNFKKYYLVYVLEHEKEYNRNGLMNTFKFNNNRVKVFQESLEIRHKSAEAMNGLKILIQDLNDKLKKYKGNLVGRYKKLLTKKSLDYINDTFDPRRGSEIHIEKENDEKDKKLRIIDDKENGIVDFFGKNEKSKERVVLDEDIVEDKIKDVLYDKIITKIYFWLHENSASYKNIEDVEKYDYDMETIKGETKIKSIIENNVNKFLEIVSLSDFDKDELKKVLRIFKEFFDPRLRKIREKRKQREERAKKVMDKFKHITEKTKSIAKLNQMFQGRNLLGDNSGSSDIDVLGKLKHFAQKSIRDNEKIDEKKNYKFKQFEEILGMKVFKNYLTKQYLINNIFLFLQSFFIYHFTAICYATMILNHIISASVFTLFYPLSVFLYALLEYPRPKKFYWIICIYYTLFIILAKFIIQIKVITFLIPDESKKTGTEVYKEMIDYLYRYKFGFKYCDGTFSGEFFYYIIFDIITLTNLLINRNLLISDGLWDKREHEIENIYQASERIAIYQTKKYDNKSDEMKDLLLKYLYSPLELSHLIKFNENDLKKKEQIKQKFPLFVHYEKDKNDIYQENHRSYFSRLFPKIRNEKPGTDYYPIYTVSMCLICMYILIFFTLMVQDKTFGTVNLDTTQFSGTMVLYLIFHIFILTCDRIIYVEQNRDDISYEYIFYKRNEKNEMGELLEEKEVNKLKSEICKKSKEKFTIIPPNLIDDINKKHNILFIQKETFNKPLLFKYILHIIVILFGHMVIFFYFPMKGNLNLGNQVFCVKDEQCNDFSKNYLIVLYYLLYLPYMIFSALQIKYGYYDIKRKSFFKKEKDELFSNMAKLFNNIPFLYELKNAIDWTFTNTSLTLFQWIKFEAIYDTIFDTYCEKGDWDEKPVGKRVDKKMKLGLGGTLAFGLIFTLIIPLILFSSLNPTNKLNNVTNAQIKVLLSFNYQNGAEKSYSLFENERADSISQMSKSSVNSGSSDDDSEEKESKEEEEQDEKESETEKEAEKETEKDTNSTLRLLETSSTSNTTSSKSIWEIYGYSSNTQTRNFNQQQVQRIIFSNTSDRNWDLANPHINNLIKLLDTTSKSNSGLSTIEINIIYTLTRPLPAEAQTLSDKFTVTIYDSSSSQDTTDIETFRYALENCKDFNITLNDAYSPPIRLTSGSEVSLISDVMSKDVRLSYLGCKNESNKINYINSYFMFETVDNGTTEPIELHIFNDQISETTTGYSVLTFYSAFVLLVGSYVREFLESSPETIMFDEMPHPQKIVDLCEGVKIARYENKFKEEEYLYTMLIELMRSPDYLKILTSSSLDQFNMREELVLDEEDE